ncbi:MAG: trigger factor [Betaproteobacteria bacterium]
MTASPSVTPSSLERRLQLTVSIAEVEQEAQKRLQRISRSVKMPGFRPGKVPMKVVAQTYGAQAQSEAMNEVIGRVYGHAVVEQKLRVAGPPSIEPAKESAQSDQVLNFEAVVEVYPEIACPELAGVEIQQVSCDITEADIDRTIETLRKQRTAFEEASRPSQKGDRVMLDFIGEIDGVPFTGGSSENYSFVLGDGSMLKEFDEAATNMKAGETKTFPLQFPQDYHGKDVAGKLASFKIKIRSVGEPKIPTLDEAFVKTMGIASGDLATFREDVRKNLSREVATRCKSKTKTAVMDALNQWASFEVPKALVQSESQRMADSTREDMTARGMNMKDVPIPADLFTEQATRRVKLGLLVGEIVRIKELRPTEAQIRAFVEELGSAYEKPEAFVNWFLGQPKQRAEAEAVVIEDNVVTWALSQAKVVDNPMTVEALMADAGQTA